MRQSLSFCLTLIGLVLVGSAHADRIYIKGQKKYKQAEIQKEDAKGIRLKGGEFIPASNILAIEYEIDPISLRIKTYRNAIQAELDADKASDGQEKRLKVRAALENYQKTLAAMQPKRPDAVRAIQFNIAELQARQVRESFGDPQLAINALEKFKLTYPDSWQITDCLKTLAELYAHKGKYPQAIKTYEELASAPVSKEMQQQASLLAAMVNVEAGNNDAAASRLRSLIKKLPRNGEMYGRAKIAQARNLLAMNKIATAQSELRSLIKETSDKKLKAYAYNTLGESYLKRDQAKEARWAFLWVDVIYNEDPEQHAKALYHLWKIFRKEGQQDRALECLQILEQPRFAGFEYRRKAMAEKGS